MITIPQVVSGIIQNSPFLEEGLSRGIVNLSALSRQIKPEIENKLQKKVKNGAIIVALKRMGDKLTKKSKEDKFLENLGDLTVRSKLMEITFENSPTLFEAQKKLYNDISRSKELFCTFSQGVSETTLIMNHSLENDVSKIFSGEKVVAKYENLASITISYPSWVVATPGVYYSILKLLAWNGINVFEVISTYTELTIIVSEENVGRTFSTLKASIK